MLSTTELERALAAAGLVAPVHFDEVTGSTNATALEMAEAGAPEWTLIAAAHQSAGRGRQGRTWLDRPGDALMFSFVLRPGALSPEHYGLIPLLAGVAMTEAIERVAHLEVRCKWPNDLMLDGAKVGGILVESSVGEGAALFAVVGVGVNLEPPSHVAGAAGLGDVEPVALLSEFLRRFHRGYAGLPADVVERWSAVSATLGREVEATRVDASRIRGRAIAVDERGALVIETTEGSVTVASGEVEHLGSAEEPS
jgi:BirA family transcriptional regulator, biotin operon repressor / biotin---[acetyl-CoA-carboxylase] ligase